MTFTTGFLGLERVSARNGYIFVQFSDLSMLQLPLEDARRIAEHISQALQDLEAGANEGVKIDARTGRPVTT